MKNTLNEQSKRVDTEILRLLVKNKVMAYRKAFEKRGYIPILETLDEYMYAGIEQGFCVMNITINKITGEVGYKA